MKHLTGFAYILLLSLGIHCTSNTKQQEAAVAEVNTFTSASNLLELDPRFNEMDSLELVFYTDPYRADSLKYTRFYTQVPVVDTVFLTQFRSNLSYRHNKKEKPAPCRNEGKIWCFSKGAVFQTVYFSSRCPDCCFMYVIKDGFFFYVDINQPFMDLLTSSKKTSKATD